MERPAKVPRLHRPGQRVNPPPDPHLPIRRSPNSVPIALELETSVDIAANQLDLSEDYCLADEYAIDDDPHVEWALRPLLPTAGTAHSHGPKRSMHRLVL